MRKLAGGLVTGGERVLVFGMLFDRGVGLAVQIGGKAGKGCCSEASFCCEACNVFLAAS